jgi:hypothetical protein
MQLQYHEIQKKTLTLPVLVYNELTTPLIQNQFKISEGSKWNSHQMQCVYSSRKFKNYRICPIRIEIIHGRPSCANFC